MHDDGPPVPRSVSDDRCLDGIEGHARGAIADGVDMRIESEGIDRRDGQGELGGIPVRHALRVRAVAVGLEEGARA
ncbi:unannotated protein [freshwater metagenome]|uniref:Unannotated protein n=1 Tax=freshwater metagenome TaxID=449393 RepID=A0A6J7L6D2_9ZZZZ